MDVHLHADETQLYITFIGRDSQNKVARFEACVGEINESKAWIVENRLMLNEDKTIFLLL